MHFGLNFPWIKFSSFVKYWIIFWTDLHKIWDEVFCSEATPIEYAEMLDKLRSRYCLNRWQTCPKRDLRDGLCAITFSFFVLSHHNAKHYLNVEMLHRFLVYFVDLYKNNPWRSETCSLASGLFTWSLQVTAMIQCSKFVDLYICRWFRWHIKPWYYSLHYLIHYYNNYYWDPNFENIDFKSIFNQSIW